MFGNGAWSMDGDWESSKSRGGCRFLEMVMEREREGGEDPAVRTRGLRSWKMKNEFSYIDKNAGVCKIGIVTRLRRQHYVCFDNF